jgi:hypothetical protein
MKGLTFDRHVPGLLARARGPAGGQKGLGGRLALLVPENAGTQHRKQRRTQWSARQFPPWFCQAAGKLAETSHAYAEWVAKRVEAMFSSYRWDDFENPESFSTQVCINLSSRSPEVVEYVTSPNTGGADTSLMAAKD